MKRKAIFILICIAFAWVLSAGCGGSGGTPQAHVEGDVNGDGKADPIFIAGGWRGGDSTGRAYLFYGGAVASGSASTAAATISNDNPGDRMLAEYTMDLNNDGFADIGLLANLATGRGRHSIFYGGAGAAPISGAHSATDASLILTGTADGDHLSAHGFDDVNGDGATDIVLSAFGCDSLAGCIYAFFGPTFASGDASTADVTLTGENAGDQLFSFVLGDINGNGIADIVASAPDADGGAGRIYIFFGGSALASKGAAQADVIITGVAADDHLTAGAIADVNGDGANDLIASSPSHGTTHGKVYIFSGPDLVTTTADHADVVFTSEGADDRFAAEVFAGDVNGDDIDDIVVSATSFGGNTGRIYAFFGSESLSSKGAGSADVLLTGENASDQLVPAALGDVSGDGIKDIIASSMTYPATDPVSPNKGRIYAFFGGSTLASKNAGSANVILTGEMSGDFFGAPLKLLDVNGDSAMDLVTGTPDHDANRGRGYIFYGGSGLASEGAGAADVILDGENPSDAFGS
jgi:FG-GAP repeat